MADWLQTRRELLCLDVIDRLQPVSAIAINAFIGMPLADIERHLENLEGQGRVQRYVGHDQRSGEDGATLSMRQAQAPRVGWSSDSLIMFCGDEAPSVMDESDALPSDDSVTE